MWEAEGSWTCLGFILMDICWLKAVLPCLVVVNHVKPLPVVISVYFLTVFFSRPLSNVVVMTKWWVPSIVLCDRAAAAELSARFVMSWSSVSGPGTVGLQPKTAWIGLCGKSSEVCWPYSGAHCVATEPCDVLNTCPAWWPWRVPVVRVISVLFLPDHYRVCTRYVCYLDEHQTPTDLFWVDQIKALLCASSFGCFVC